MHYGGKAINLEPEAEEVATFFAAIVGTDHYENEIFRNNFFEDWCGVLHSINSSYKDLIKEFHKCDFSPITEHLNLLKERKKSMTKEEKIKIKEEKTKIDEFYGWCLLDGRREKVGNFRIEPPGLFRGRGKHPKAGRLKTRVFPEQVTINISKDAKIPSPPPGHSWGKIVNDNTVTWLATWVENINKSQKYVFLAAGSSLKGQSDLKKFETARELNKHVGNIRRVNAEELRSKEMFVRQRATALWLIDRLALRAGNEKGDEEADTVGCCSLRCEHVRLQEPNIVIFDFLGKDSIRYYNEVPVEPIIFKNLGIFMRSPKTSQDPIFDRLNTATLNKYLTGLMPGLTAKVFRTYNASHTFQQELDKTLSEGTIHELVLAYNRANREVAVLCNHQRAVPKSHQQSMEKLTEKILTMKYERHLIRQVLREVASKKELQSECPEALQPEPDLDVETIKRKAAETAAAEREKDANLKEGSPKKRTSNPSKESLLKKFSTLTSRIEAAHNQRIDKDENKTTALGTSKTNYLDPRITIAWCEKHKVPIEKMFNKSLREKFKWAMSVDGDWRF
jgi:DNA topoisomerase-1